MTRTWMIAVGAFACLTLGGGAQRDEFECEQAVAHLAACCPNLSGHSFYCSHDGCTTVHNPDFSEDESACIEGRSCDELRATGVCDRVRNLPPTGHHPGTDCTGGGDNVQCPTVTTGHPPVCAAGQ